MKVKSNRECLCDPKNPIKIIPKERRRPRNYPTKRNFFLKNKTMWKCGTCGVAIINPEME